MDALHTAYIHSYNDTKMIKNQIRLMRVTVKYT